MRHRLSVSDDDPPPGARATRSIPGPADLRHHLIRRDDGVTINRGCVLQTHLFHHRLMRISGVHVGAGSSLGPHSITLPGTSIGAGTGIGAGSLVMRGEHVPAGSRWAGNPIAAVGREHRVPRRRRR